MALVGFFFAASTFGLLLLCTPPPLGGVFLSLIRLVVLSSLQKDSLSSYLKIAIQLNDVVQLSSTFCTASKEKEKKQHHPKVGGKEQHQPKGVWCVSHPAFGLVLRFSLYPLGWCCLLPLSPSGWWCFATLFGGVVQCVLLNCIRSLSSIMQVT